MKYNLHSISKFIAMIVLILTWAFWIYRGMTNKVVLIGSILLLTGITLNALALCFNKFKMPVKDYQGRSREDNLHKPFNSRKNVKLYYLTDIIYIKFGMASIGDILLAIGFIINMIGIFIW